jgi:putative two-component system response regulator
MINKPIILIVDDTATNIDILIEYLDSRYEILVALDGKNALEIINEEKIDLILLDIVMPDIVILNMIQ